MRVTAVFLYPLKSARAVEVAAAEVEPRGLAGDRRWMVVDEAGVFLSQRTTPALARIDASLTAWGLRLSAEGAGVIEVEVPAPGAARRTVGVWDDRVTVASAGDRADAWLGERLGRRCALVHMPDDSRRPVDPRFAGAGDVVSFADGYPLLVTSQSSLADLAQRAGEPVPMDRFRPNLVVEGAAPYAEDTWRRLRVGEVVFRVAKPCARCVVTTTDQTTGARGVEPMSTLARYRRTAAGVVFGQNLVPDGTGLVRRGDPVEVLESS